MDGSRILNGPAPRTARAALRAARSAARKWAALTIAVVLGGQLAFGLAQSIGGEGDYAALVGKADWQVKDGFVPLDVALPRTEVPPEMAGHAEWAMWRSWSPEKGSTRGSITSAAFQTPAHLAVSYQGFPGDTAGNRIYVECVDTHRQADVSTRRTNTQFATAFLELGKAFCAGRSMLVATSDGSNYVAVGTPFRIDAAVYHAQTNVAPRLLVALLTLGIIACHLFVGHAAAVRWLGARDPFVASFALFGGLGMAEIAIFVLRPTAARGLAALACFAVLVAAAWIAASRPAAMRAWLAEMGRPLVLWGLVTLLYVALVAAVDSGGGSWAINGLFSPLRWSTDNQLPMIVTEGFYDGVPPAQIMIPPWHGFDRTPLLSGLLLPFRAAVIAPLAHLFGPVFIPTAYMIVCATVLALWVPVMFAACRLLGHRRAGTLVVCLAAVSPFFLFNTLYVWPKMLGGSFALMAYCLLYRMRADRSHGTVDLTWVAIFAACAYLAHASNAFVLLPIAVFFLPTMLRQGVRRLAIAGIAFAILAGGWSWFAGATQPHSNALLRFALANDFGMQDRSASLWTSTTTAYHALGWGGWLHQKVGEFARLFVFSPYSPEMATYSPDTGWQGDARVADFVVLARSLGLAAIVAVVVLVLPRRMTSRVFATPLDDAIRTPVVLGAVAIAFSVLCLLPTTSTVTLPYGAVLLVFLGAAMALQQAAAPIRIFVLAAAALYCAHVWIWSPIANSLRAHGAAQFALVELAAIFVLLVWRRGGALRDDAVVGAA